MSCLESSDEEWQLGGALDPSDFSDLVVHSVADNIGPICIKDNCYTYGSGIDVRQESEKGTRVLELGCGCGLVGLVWASLGADVLLTDLSNVVGLIQSNIDRNAVAIAAAGGTATAAALPWGEPVDALGTWAAPDVIVASDVVYDRDLFDLLLETLGLLGKPGTRLLLAHVRRWKTDKRFFGGLQRLYDVTDITGQLDEEAAKLSSHTKGSRRLFSCVKK